MKKFHIWIFVHKNTHNLWHTDFDIFFDCLRNMGPACEWWTLALSNSLIELNYETEIRRITNYAHNQLSKKQFILIIICKASFQCVQVTDQSNKRYDKYCPNTLVACKNPCCSHALPDVCFLSDPSKATNNTHFQPHHFITDQISVNASEWCLKIHYGTRICKIPRVFAC